MSGSGRFGGHFVLGHVDELGTISKINETANSKIISIKTTKNILNQMVKQGSITVDGVSLTVFDLHDYTLIYILYQKHVDLLFFHLKKWATKCT